MNEVLDVVCGDLGFGVSVLEAVVGGDGLQVVRVPAGDLLGKACVASFLVR